jgi:rod shape-determining protein MreB
VKRVSNLISSFSDKFIKKQGDLLLDFGSGSARFYLDGKLIKTQSSSFSNIHNNDFEKMRLVDRGTIASFEYATRFLDQTLSSLINRKKLWPRFDGYYLAPSDSTQVEQIIAKKVLSSLKCGNWKMVTKKNVVKTPHGGVIDIGFDLTEVILGVGTGNIVAKTIKSGSRSFTKIIRKVVRDKYQLDVSWAGADKIKKELVGEDFLLSTQPIKQKITVRGKDVYTFVPKTIVIEASVLQKPLLEKVEELFDEIKLFFSKISTNILMNSIEQGIDLWGDGAKMASLDNFFSQKLQTTVKKGQASYEVHQ